MASLALAVGMVALSGCAGCSHGDVLCSSRPHPNPGWIRPSEDGARFLCSECGNRFVAWGFNYDHDASGRLLEDYWDGEWSTIEEDFREMEELGANVVRVHPQLARFMESAERPNAEALKQLDRLVGLAETTGLHLIITGLGCYHEEDVPQWYDSLGEARRWEVQALFWEAVAKTCARSNAVFCYDLMNEPLLPGVGEKADRWLGEAFGGKHFMQFITRDLAGRTQTDVAEAWVGKLVAAIREHDERHMVTVGAVAWVHTFPNARPVFYSKEAGQHLDCVSVHMYPQEGEVEKALTAMAAYDIGKPLVLEEVSPLYCGIEEFDTFIDASRKRADGYVGFYWGQTIEDYSRPDTDMAGSIMKGWLEYFRAKGPEILQQESTDARAAAP